MTTIDLLDAKGVKADTLDLPAEIFDAKVNVPLMHQVVVAQLAAARQGTHDTKGRGEVRGGGRKPYRQKGTGRARQGSIRVPQFAGGGVVHGPTPRDYSQRTPKKMKVAALRGALSDRARAGRVHVVRGLTAPDQPKTKDAVATLRKVTQAPNVLVVVPREDELTWKSLRNVAGVHLIVADQLNTYDVLINDDVLFTEQGYLAFLASAQKNKQSLAVAQRSQQSLASAQKNKQSLAVAQESQQSLASARKDKKPAAGDDTGKEAQA